MTLEEIFQAALDKPDAASRDAYLAKACGDAKTRQRVEDLLAAHFRSGAFLESQDGTEMRDESTLDRTELRAESTDDRTVTLAGDAAPSCKHSEDSEDLHFLAPTKRPDSLGRLGNYEVLQVLGKGGFGTVFRAFDDELQRVVAVKVMAPQIAATSPARKRFLREARSSAAVRHENVVQVYEVVEQPLPYLVMEFIPGETLQDKLNRTGPLEVADIVRIGRQIAEGLAAAHATDLIHRDIKPGNVLIEGGAQHRVKITDFGLARAADDASISQSGLIAGTPMYMAPEQAKGETLDQRADLFSLGSVLYQMAAGRPPFRANSTVAVLKRVAEDTPRAIREIIPEAPQWLCDIITKLHAKNPDDRFQSAREVADVLADCEAQLKANTKLKDFSRIPLSKQPTPRKSVSWKWAAAAVLLLPVLALAVTEFAGFTHLFRPQATSNPIANQQPLPPTFKNGVGMEFVVVPKGKSWLGGGKDKLGDKEVEIPADFYLGKYEVTQEEWEKVMGENPSANSRTGNRMDAVKDISDADLKRFPVENVSWDQCQLFVAKLNQREKETGWVYRLPTEAEWEYACRGGPMADKLDSAFDYYFAKPTNTLMPEQANFGGAKGLNRTCQVGLYEPNRLGLFDMHGNVWEWCEHTEKSAVGPSPRVFVGSSFSDIIENTRTSLALTPIGERVVKILAPRNSYRYSNIGLRLARVPARVPSPAAKLADDLQVQNRYNAACSAALAAAGQGEDAAKVDDKEKSRLRQQALDWLRADLGLRTKQLKSGQPADLAQVQMTLLHWQNDTDLASIRDAAALAKLPADEQKAFTQLWADVAALLKTSIAKAPAARYQLAVALANKGQVDDAIAEFKALIQLEPKNALAHDWVAFLAVKTGDAAGALTFAEKSVELNPNVAQARWNLGRARMGLSQIDKAITEFGEALRLDPKHIGARNDLARAETALALTKRLPAILRNEDKPADNAERLTFAQLAYNGKKYAHATRLWTEALASDPKLGDDRQAQHRYKAACSAALAAAGQGEDAAKLDDPERTRLRKQAFDWLRADLALRTKQLESGQPAARAEVQRTMLHWQKNTDLADIRDAAALAKLPADEQKAFTQLWADVAALLKKAPPSLDELLAALPEARKTLPKDSPQLAGLLSQIGLGLLERKQWAEAEPHLRECLTIREKTQPDAWTTFNTQSMLGGALLGQKKYAAAEPLLVAGYEGMKAREKTIPQNGGAELRIPEALDRLIELYTATNKPDEVKKYRALLIEHPAGTLLTLLLATLHAWHGEDKEYGETVTWALEAARQTRSPSVAERSAKLSCLRPVDDKAIAEAALRLAKKAVELGKPDDPYWGWFQMALGMAQYRSGLFADAEATLAPLTVKAKNLRLSHTVGFYRAMTLFRLGKVDEAKTLATETSKAMRPLPADAKYPSANGANLDDIIVWLAYREAKELIQFEAVPPKQAPKPAGTN